MIVIEQHITVSFQFFIPWLSCCFSVQDTRIRVVDKGPQKRSNSLTITNPVVGGALTNIFTTDSREELEDWMEAFWQHFYDQSECLEELAKTLISCCYFHRFNPNCISLPNALI